jgi:hypothetical protein
MSNVLTEQVFGAIGWDLVSYLHVWTNCPFKCMNQTFHNRFPGTNIFHTQIGPRFTSLFIWFSRELPSHQKYIPCQVFWLEDRIFLFWYDFSFICSVLSRIGLSHIYECNAVIYTVLLGLARFHFWDILLLWI